MNEGLRELSEALVDEDPEVREESAQAIAELGDPSAAPLLARALDDDLDTVRMWGAYGLGKLHSQAHLAKLMKLAQTDENTLVRLWATYGALNAGEKTVGPKLVAFLNDPSLDVRNNAADALCSLKTSEMVRPLLEKALSAGNERVKVWASGILHRLRFPGAFDTWRAALLSPGTRIDAAMVASHLQDGRAARELVRVVTELPEDELMVTVEDAGELTLGDVLTLPLADLGVRELVEAAAKDENLRADLLLFLVKAPSADPEVLDDIQQIFSSRPPAEVGQQLADILQEQDHADRLLLLGRSADYVPNAVIPALSVLPAAERERLFTELTQIVEEDHDEAFVVASLLETLKKSGPHADRFADMSLAEPDDDEATLFDDSLPPEDDLTPLVERLAGGEELDPAERERVQTLLDELGCTAEEYLEGLDNAAEEMGDDLPPDGSQVAQRALALGGMVQRWIIEDDIRNKRVPGPAASAAAEKLRGWMEEQGLTELLNEEERQLLAADVGHWPEDLAEMVAYSAEGLGALLWALGLTAKLSPDAAVKPRELVKLLPLNQAADGFVENSSLKPAEEVDAQRELSEAWQWRAEQEELARQAARGEELDIDVDELFLDVDAEGFDRAGLQKKLGRNGMLAEAFRFVARKMADQLADRGLLDKRAEGDFAFRGRPFYSVDEAELLWVLSAHTERQRALEWLAFGDPLGDAGDLDDELFDDED